MLLTQLLATAFVIVGVLLLLYIIGGYLCCGVIKFGNKNNYYDEVVVLSGTITDYIITVGVIILIYDLTIHLIS